MAINSYDVTCEKKKSKKHEARSPYLTSDRVQLLSRVTEKRVIQKKTLDYVSSFPLAANIYKANSDEFKSLKRAKKKIKKSVLTLPTEPSHTPQVCTVSDMNDSEYYSQNNDNQDSRIKKRSSIKNVRKSRAQNKNFEFFDRDAQFCTQLNLDSSSTDLIKDFKGDGKRLSKRQKGYKCTYSSQKSKENESDVKPHDVWAVLRNMKRFQFKPSPPVSDESILSPKKKKKAAKKRVNCKDTRVIETRRTEEIAYISSYKLGDSSRSVSQTSSFDRITVINKQDQFSKICKDFEERFLKPGLSDSTNNNRVETSNKIHKKKAKKVPVKCIVPTITNENSTELTPVKRNDFCQNIQNEEKTDNNVNDVPSLINIDDAHYANYSELTSVCSKINNDDNELKIESSEPAKEFCIYSDNSGSSKAEIIAEETHKEKGNNVFNGRVPRLKGISKVIFGNKCEPIDQTVPRRAPSDEQKRKSRLVTTMPSGCTMPKLTRTEIKRRLATIKFPVVILGREQVNSFIEVERYDHPQFDGLDKQVWPFMMGWDDKNQFASEEINMIKHNIELKDNNGQLSRKCNNLYPDSNLNKLRKINNEININKRPNLKPKRHINSELITNKNKTELQREITPPEINKLPQFKKQESIANIKEKMLNLLYKKISDRKIDDIDYNKPKDIKPPRLHSAVKKVDVSTEIQTKAIVTPAKPKIYGSPVRNQNKKNQRNGIRRHPWAKAKWASDFIENVIKKIKSGVYYSQGVNRVTEISIQTEPIFELEDIYENNFSPKVSIKKKHIDVPKSIPGFENSLSGLEIKSLNMNQISIKHCIANVMMQFDVTMPGERKQLMMSPKASISLIPVEGSESHTKIFKCKTSIVNAMLPAEICSIIPKMVNLLEPNVSTTRSALCPGSMHKTESHLTTISETTLIETVSMSTETPVSSKSSLECLSPAVKKILGGMFANGYCISKDQGANKIIPFISSDIVIVKVLPKIFFKDTDIITYRIRSFVPVFFDVNKNGMFNNQSKTNLLQKHRPICTALEPYISRNKRIALPFEPYDFVSIIRNILRPKTICIINTNLTLNMNTFKIQCDCQVLNMRFPSYQEVGDKANMALNTAKAEPQFCKNTGVNNLITQNTSPKKSIEFIKRSASFNCERRDPRSEMDMKTTNNKNRRKGFYRLYRKCKSTSNIPTVEKVINTPLNKIQTLEDFFQILGSKRLMSSIFDGYAAKKILSSIGEMKNWITDINPRQALLVLLLTNKKDTPNLVRFRPILLQGIAVNRITRATELDMEIEVIERENLNKLPQYEGISYLPASTENHDQLLEELYWIAKTTASDYQRPFDESSERLLRSLLEKRKKLNPSYLRVMARYVGLGLLKAPAKK